MLVIYKYLAIIGRRLGSYEVLPPLKISGIARELPCLNESFVAHHRPELQAKQVLTYLGGGPVLTVPSTITHWGASIIC
jgi:hypothetical protein